MIPPISSATFCDLKGHVDAYAQTGTQAGNPALVTAAQELEAKIAHDIEDGMAHATSDDERAALTAMGDKLKAIVTAFKASTELELAREKLAAETLSVAGPKLVATLEALLKKAVIAGDTATALAAADRAECCDHGALNRQSDAGPARDGRCRQGRGSAYRHRRESVGAGTARRR